MIDHRKEALDGIFSSYPWKSEESVVLIYRTTEWQLSFWHVSVSNASLSRVGYLVLSVEKKEENLEVIRHHHHHEMCQYKISCKATQKYWFFIEINSLRILDIQCAIWNNIKKIETINIDINSLVCKCDLFYIIFNEIANFLKQLAENVI